MRIWDIDTKFLCDKHLLGEHRELHAIWTILTEDKRGYRSHPETKRWEGKLKALYKRHDEEVREMQRRGFRHLSNLDVSKATGSSVQDTFVDSPQEQREILQGKNCGCIIMT